jgi:hypothetical protein
MKKCTIGLALILFALSALTDLGHVIFIILFAVGLIFRWLGTKACFQG